MLNRAVIFLLLLISLIKAQTTGNSLDEYYYTTMDTTNNVVNSQDSIDAQAIVDDKMSEKIFASILPFREKIRRMSIIQDIRAKTGGVDYITDNYVPQDPKGSVFKDLVYGLTKDENIVLGGYLGNFFEALDETWIIIAMVLTKDMGQMITTFDKCQAPMAFAAERKKQRSPFEHMLRAWVRQNREANEKENLDKAKVTNDATTLKSECDDGGWKEHRDQIENILIKKSIKYAQAVIAEFEKSAGKPLEEIIHENVEKHGLNHDLADAYATMASYIKNKHKYIADIMFEHSDGKDRWAAWIMCIAVTTPKEWPIVDGELQKCKGVTLSKIILEKMTDDKLMAEMIAAVVDSKFKPTLFTPILTKDGTTSGLTPPAASTTPAPLGLSSAPPPVSPTVIAPHPSTSTPPSSTPSTTVAPPATVSPSPPPPPPASPPASPPPSATSQPPATSTPSTSSSSSSPPPAPVKTPTPGAVAPISPATPPSTPPPTVSSPPG